MCVHVFIVSSQGVVRAGARVPAGSEGRLRRTEGGGAEEQTLLPVRPLFTDDVHLRYPNEHAAHHHRVERYREFWKNSLSTIVFLVGLVQFLEDSRLISLKEVEELLGRTLRSSSSLGPPADL